MAKRKAKPGSKRSAARSGGSASVTLADVAKVAGVSPITVSRALTRPDLVNARTLEQIRAVVAAMGYVPNLAAGSLRSRRTHLVAAIVPQVTNSIFIDTIQALTDRLAAAGFQLLLGLSGYRQGEEDLVTAILSRRPDAVCLTGISHSAASRRRLLQAGIPVVETWDLTPTPIDMLVGFSHDRVGAAVAEYLLRKGHRRFGLVWADDERALKRRDAVLSALNKAGIGEVPIHAGPAPGTLRLGREGLAQLLERGTPLDAVICSSDAVAQGALIEAQVRGLAVPSDCAVMGFGDLEFAAYTKPSLTTIQVDRYAIGRLAAEALIDKLAGRTAREAIVDVGFRLIERASA